MRQGQQCVVDAGLQCASTQVACAALASQLGVVIPLGSGKAWSKSLPLFNGGKLCGNTCKFDPTPCSTWFGQLLSFAPGLLVEIPPIPDYGAVSVRVNMLFGRSLAFAQGLF
jgi:hypothetical protein